MICTRRVIERLFAIDITNYRTLPDEICRVMVDSIAGVKFVSLLTYNRQTSELVYRSVTFDSKRIDKDKITSLIKPHIVLKVKDSTAGRLIRSDSSILICDNVLQDPDFKSTELAAFLNLRVGIFLKIADPTNKEIFGVLILYPDEDSQCLSPSHGDLQLIISTIESILSNANRIKENTILEEILGAAKKVRKDLSSFLHKCVEITSREISARGCSIFVLDPVDQLLKLKATLGIRPGPKFKHKYGSFAKNQVFYEAGEGVTGKIVQTNRAAIRHRMDISESKWIEESMSSTFLGMPISKIDEDEAIGVVRCATRPNTLVDDTVEAFDHEDIQLVTYIASLLSVFIELALYQERQKQFIIKMPHEMRAAIGNIVSIGDYLRRTHERFAETYGRSLRNFDTKLQDMLSECQLAKMTVDSLAAYEDSCEAYHFERVDIFTKIIAKVRKMLNPLATSERNLQITYDNSSKMPMIYVDPYRMQLVFHNLLINAIKYSAESQSGGPSGDIIIRSERSDDERFFLVHVSNEGLPIPESMGKNIFINGFRTIEATAIDPGGRGFGLALVKSIVKCHKSSIDVTNFGNPTTFTLRFPTALEKSTPREIPE